MDNPIFKYVLTFDEFITPKFIVIIYYVGLVLIALGVLGSIFGPTGFAMKLVALFIVLPIAAMFWRISCEFMLLAFRIYDRLGEIAKK